MKKFLPILAALTASSANAAVLINYDAGAASVGNGAMFSDPTGVDVPAGVALNGAAALSTNTSGRALSGVGTSPGGDLLDLPTITDNRGVGISGFSTYRLNYFGGNNAIGFLEDAAARLNVGTGVDHNGSAFANGNDIVTVSDFHPVVAAAGTDMINVGVLAGSDTGDFDMGTYLAFNDGGTITEVLLGSTSISGVGLARQTFSGTAASFGAPASYDSIAVYFSADGSAGERVLFDNAFLEVTPIPEPSSAILGLLGGLFLFRRKR